MAAVARRLELQRERRDFDLAMSRWCVTARRALAAPNYETLTAAVRRPLELEAAAIVQGDAALSEALRAFDEEVDRRWFELLEPLLAVRQPQQDKEDALDRKDFAAAADARTREVQILNDGHRSFSAVSRVLAGVEAVLVQRARPEP